LTPFWTLNWGQYSDFLTFKGGLNPVTGSLWLTDTAHHHLALAVLFIVAGHMYRTNWGIGHSLRETREPQRPFTGEGHRVFTKPDDILACSRINLAMLGVTIIVERHMCTRCPSVHIDYATAFHLYPPHVDWCLLHRWWSSPRHHFMVGLRSSSEPKQPARSSTASPDAIISHLNWVYVPELPALACKTMTRCSFGSPQDMFSDTAIQLQPVFAQFVQNIQTLLRVQLLLIN